MRKYKTIMCLIIIIKNILFIPVFITGGIAEVHLNGYISLYGYLTQDRGCCDMFIYDINYLRLFIESFVIVLILFVIYLLIKKIKK